MTKRKRDDDEPQRAAKDACSSAGEAQAKARSAVLGALEQLVVEATACRRDMARGCELAASLIDREIACTSDETVGHWVQCSIQAIRLALDNSYKQLQEQAAACIERKRRLLNARRVQHEAEDRS